MNKPIAITLGDFNGIGPEIVVKALNRLDLPQENILLIGSSELVKDLNKKYNVLELPFEHSWLNIGKETKEAGNFSYNCILKACELAKADKIKAIVTAPVSKNAMHLAGHNFSGQTEVLEKNLANPVVDEKAEMLFVSKDLRVLLLTRHVALKDVKITKELLLEKLKRINRVLKQNFGIPKPKIALCSLNPHAGENGILGNEEIEVFLPAVKDLNNDGINVFGPFPSDTLFAKAAHPYVNGDAQPYDVYCACYHDQGLIPVKVLAMNNTVNTTVGLSVIRTSPAHGTAYDIAGKNIADESSMICAIEAAL